MGWLRRVCGEKQAAVAQVMEAESEVRETTFAASFFFVPAGATLLLFFTFLPTYLLVALSYVYANSGCVAASWLCVL